MQGLANSTICTFCSLHFWVVGWRPTRSCTVFGYPSTHVNAHSCMKVTPFSTTVFNISVVTSSLSVAFPVFSLWFLSSSTSSFIILYTHLLHSVTLVVSPYCHQIALPYILPTSSSFHVDQQALFHLHIFLHSHPLWLLPALAISHLYVYFFASVQTF